MSEVSKKATGKTVHANTPGDKTSAAAASVKPAKQEETVVYIGPDFKNIISKNTIFKNGIPPEITEKAGTSPAIMRLFVPLKDLPGAVKSAAQGGMYKQLYDNAAKEMAEIDKGENAYE